MRRFLPSLAALQAFESAARHLSFTRAAEDLMLTQSGISRQIGNLESRLGVKLFERTGSRLILTDAGRIYAEDVRQSLDRLEEVSIDAVRGRKAGMAVRMGMPPTFASRWLVPRLPGLAAAFPDIPAEIVDLRPGSGIDTGTLDICVLRGVEAWRASPLFPELLAVVGAPELLGRCQPLDGELDFERLPTLQNASRPTLWLAWLRASKRSYRGAIQGLRLPQNEMLIQGALAGLGLAVVPVHYVLTELAEGRLVLPFGAPVPSGESYFVAIPEERAHRAGLLAIRDWMLREARSGAPELARAGIRKRPHDEKS